MFICQVWPEPAERFLVQLVYKLLKTVLRGEWYISIVKHAPLNALPGHHRHHHSYYELLSFNTLWSLHSHYA